MKPSQLKPLCPGLKGWRCPRGGHSTLYAHCMSSPTNWWTKTSLYWDIRNVDIFCQIFQGEKAGEKSKKEQKQKSQAQLWMCPTVLLVFRIRLAWLFKSVGFFLHCSQCDTKFGSSHSKRRRRMHVFHVLTWTSHRLSKAARTTRSHCITSDVNAPQKQLRAQQSARRHHLFLGKIRMPLCRFLLHLYFPTKAALVEIWLDRQEQPLLQTARLKTWNREINLTRQI